VTTGYYSRTDNKLNKRETLIMKNKENKILIIDDVASNIAMIVTLLKDSMPDAIVFSATSGMEGLSLAVSEDPDVILLDIHMPYMDGFEVCEKLKKDPATFDIPVVFVTGHTDSGNRVRALETGAEGFLNKPVDDAELYAQVKAMVKIKQANIARKTEKKRLAHLVDERTRQLTEANRQAHELLESLKVENAAKLLAEQKMMKALERAEESNRLKASFIRNTSHEFRTPMHGIINFVDELLDDNADLEKLKLDRFSLRQSTDRLLQTVTDVMDISIITSGNLEIKQSSLMPDMLIAQVYQAYESEAHAKGIEFTLQTPAGDDIIYILSDEKLIRKTLGHLVSNSIKFTAAGSVSCGYEIQDDKISFFVRDTGKGIAPEFMRFLWMPFMQEEVDDTRGYEGSGLGLAIAKGITEALGGSVSVETVQGKGSSFSITLPLNRTIEKPLAATQIIEAEPVSQPLILIAEDDETNYILLETLLRKSGFEILHAWNGLQAVEMVQENPAINLVLMDIKMPLMDGIEATRKIKSLRKELLVIAITAFALSGDEERIREAGCNDYITKPIRGIELRNKLKTYGFGKT
jgi:CheY-like chemotaxis protein